MTTKDDDGNSAFSPDFADEILSGSCVTHGGRIVHEPTREAIEGPAEPEPARPPEPVSQSGEPETTGPAVEQPDLPYDQEADQ